MRKSQESIFIRGKQDIKMKRLKVLEKVNVKHERKRVTRRETTVE